MYRIVFRTTFDATITTIVRQDRQDAEHQFTELRANPNVSTITLEIVK